MSASSLLFYGDVLVAEVSEAVFSDNTWHGVYKARIQETGDLEQRLSEFIAFFKDWNYRTSTNLDNPPDASEFNQYEDLLRSKLWCMKFDDGRISAPLNGAPNFMDEGILAWRFQ